MTDASAPAALGGDHAVRTGKARTALLTIGAIGVVYGDIGTSPLYAFRETLRPAIAAGLTEAAVIGCASLLVWALIVIVTLKYVTFLLLADNRGEGGVLALYARVRAATPDPSVFLLLLAVCGAAFFFGDAVLTPAISVLSAAEGMAIIAPGVEPFVLPIAVGIVTALFTLQRRGTGAISVWFGPICLVWFLTLGVTGLTWVMERPDVLRALSPFPGLGFLATHGALGLLVMSGVFLAVTGAEALYADLGHFGRLPIRMAWLVVVFPCLVLAYLGQAALVLIHPETVENPFFLSVSEAMQPFLIVLATAATVIASQAVITGAFSLGRQALLLGLLPRLEIRHTSQTHHGQIYIPVMNWALMVGTLWLMLEFGTSSALASAYGIAVVGTMIVTSLLALLYLVRIRGYGHVRAFLSVLPILVVEAAFAAANFTKLHEGGYVPVLIAVAMLLVMWAWVRGTAMISAKTRHTEIPLEGFLSSMRGSSVARVPGTAFFLTGDGSTVPAALLHNLKHNRVLHARNVLLTVKTASVPHVDDDERLEMEDLGQGFQRVTLRFGFMETPNVSRALGLARREGLKFDVMSTSFFLGRRRYVPGMRIGMSRILDRIYVALTRVAADPIDYFHLPRDRVVEIGARMSV
jgi:KUP system potassium uptake protein